MNKYTPIHTHAQLVEALRRGLTVEINSKDNESAADYQAPHGGGWVAGLPAVTTAADDPDSYAWSGFAFRAVGEHDLSSAKPEPEDTMAKYTLIHTQAELARAIELGLSLEKAVKPDGAFISDVSGWDAYLPGGALESCFYDWTFRAVGEHDLTPAKPDGAFISGFGGWDAYLPGGRVLELKTGEPLAVGEHDLSPAQPEPKPLTNADFNPGDIVRFYGKEWRVQGIDDYDGSDAGLLLLDVAAPEDAPYFVDTVFPVTRGIGRRPNWLGEHRWCWGSAGKAELVSRGEPEAPDSDPAKGVGAVETSPAFHVSVTIHADTPEDYVVALETLARGIEL